MKNKKGFTLVELLAVIVILAVLVLLAVPSVIKMLDNAKRNSFSTEAENIIKGATLAYADGIMNGTSKTCYSLSELNDYIDKDFSGYSGSVSIDSENNAYQIWLSNGTYVIDGGYKGDLTVVDNTGTASSACDSLLAYKEAILNGAYPRLDRGMIPVTISNSGVVTTISSSSSNWYSYTNQKWANAILVKESGTKTREYYQTNNNVIVDQADILAYFVWIPRYKYELFNATGASGTSPQAINIVFESRSTTKSTGTINGTYLTHPAFTFGSQELNGLWVGKFETTQGTSANVGTSNPTILPGITSWREQNVSTQFATAQKFQSTAYGLVTESRMMKDTEWGATAYLTQSIYGRCPNSTCTEVRINNNSNYITGYAAVTAPTTGYSSTSISTNQYGTDTSITKPYTDASTLGLASTTGNISGIYDMSGGAWEYVMAVLNNYSGMCNYYNSGYNGDYSSPSDNANCTSTLLNKTDGVNFPNPEYYTTYTSTNFNTACNNGVCYGRALGETQGWYSDYASFVSLTYPWSVRGGKFNDGTSAGVFYSGSNGGYPGSSGSFRVVAGL